MPPVLLIGGCQSLRQEFLEEVEIRLFASTDADAAVKRSDARHAHEDVTLEQFSHDALGERAVAMAIDRNKVGR